MIPLPESRSRRDEAQGIPETLPSTHLWILPGLAGEPAPVPTGRRLCGIATAQEMGMSPLWQLKKLKPVWAAPTMALSTPNPGDETAQRG